MYSKVKYTMHENYKAGLPKSSHAVHFSSNTSERLNGDEEIQPSDSVVLEKGRPAGCRGLSQSDWKLVSPSYSCILIARQGQ